MEHRFRSKLRAGELLVGTTVTLGYPEVAEILFTRNGKRLGDIQDRRAQNAVSFTGRVLTSRPECISSDRVAERS